MGDVIPWHQRDPAALASLEHLVTSAYPTLHFAVEDGFVHVRGTLPVLHGTLEIDRFAVEIILARDHPRALPTVFETAGRIPWTAERHVYRNGAACVVLPHFYWFNNTTREVDFLVFLQREVHNYFLGQLAVEAGDPWPFGEWAHDDVGLLEFFGGLFGTYDRLSLCRLLVCTVTPLKGHHPCPCGAARRYRNCHR